MLDGTTLETTTLYEYGAGADPLAGVAGDSDRQTKKTVYNGDVGAPSPAVADYGYGARGRLETVSEGGSTTTYGYNDDGVRVSSETTGDGKTLYLIDGQNHTGYAQVLEERDATLATTRAFLLGHDVLAQYDATPTAAATLAWLLYDGHGSTRGLVDATGQLLDGAIYAYDAYGVRLDGNQASTKLLYSGEWRDQNGFDYLRARPYDFRTGRFLRLDDFAGNNQDPQSLHKYAYTHNDPINWVDPSGHVRSLFGTSTWGLAVEKVIRRIYSSDHPGQDTSRSGRQTRIGPKPAPSAFGTLYRAKPDLLNKTSLKYGEIKPLSLSGLSSGAAQLVVRKAQFRGTGYKLERPWVPSTHFGTALGQRFVFVNVEGLVLYTDLIDLSEDVVGIGTVAAARRFLSRASIQQALLGARGLAGVRVSVDSARLDSQLSVGTTIASLGVI